MPIKRRVPKLRRHSGEYTQLQKDILLDGSDFFGDFSPDQRPGHVVNLHEARPGDEVDRIARRAWEDLRDELLPAWIADNPCRRPYAWWRFDAPARRERIDGKLHRFDDPARAEDNEHFGTDLYYGCPRGMMAGDDFEAEYETELEYLARLDLLTPDELIALSAMDEDEGNQVTD